MNASVKDHRCMTHVFMCSLTPAAVQVLDVEMMLPGPRLGQDSKH